ncbi:P-loop containing nucleoside triphosphate hydrolase protein, partial [Thozetella sp. PMI_491]
ELSLLVFVVLDSFRLSTLWALALHTAAAPVPWVVVALQTVTTVLYAILLIHLSWSGTGADAAGSTSRAHPPPLVPDEDSLCLVSVLSLAWINALLSFGQKHEISMNDIKRVNLHPDFVVSRPFGRLSVEGGGLSLVTQVLHDLSAKALATYVIVLGLVLLKAATTLCQPFIINALVAWLQSDQPTSYGVWLVVALSFDFIFLAVVSAQISYLTNRVTFHLRGYLVYRIHDRAILPAKTSFSPSNRASRPLVLANMDVTHVTNMLRIVGDIISNGITVGVGGYLLYEAMGTVFVGPLIVALASVTVPILMGGKLTRSQKLTLEATERRIWSTSRLISAARSIRTGGMQDLMSQEVLYSRELEIKAASLYRKILIPIIMAADSVNGISLLVAFGFYSVTNGPQLDYNRLFTALSIISVMVGPFLSFVQMLPDIYEGWVSWKRIAEYITSGPTLFKPHTTPTEPSSKAEKSEKTVVILSEASLGWTTKPILEGISLTLVPGSITCITGCAGSGKSTLLYSLLGEVHLLAGTLKRESKTISFCDQNPFFLPGRTVRENVVLQNLYDAELYTAVLDCCGLSEDIGRWEGGDASVILDTAGSAFSGGQRKRLALARALYQQSDLLILDDVFTGIDPRTVCEIRDVLFGCSGLFFDRRRHTAIVLSSPITPAILEGIAHDSINLDNCASVVKVLAERPEPDTTILIEAITTNSHTPQPSASASSNAKPEEQLKLDEETDNANAASSSLVSTGRYGALKDYRLYLKSFGFLNISLLLILIALKAGVDKASPFFLSYWAGSYHDGENYHPTGFYVGLYALLILSGVLFTLGFCVFTQDTEVLDLELPLALLNTVFAAAAVLGSIGVFAAGSVYTLLSMAVALCVLWPVQRRYLASSSQLRILQVSAQALVLGTLGASYEGRCTIRAFGMEASIRQLLIERVNQAQKPGYLFRSLQVWLQLSLGLLNAAIAGTLAALVVGLRSQIYIGWAGLALVNTISAGNDLRLLVHWWTLFESSFGVVRRIREFVTNTPSEDADQAICHVANNWPRTGNVVLENVSAVYGEIEALSNIYLKIRNGEKVAVVGRTGSSLMQLLFKQVAKKKGTVHIDNLDIETVPSQVLRQRISGLPQESFFNSLATVRCNIDPQGIHSDAEIMDMVKLIVATAPEDITVNLDMLWGDCHFSPGWERRIAIARALLRDSQVYIMDEPTSGMDIATHQLVVGAIFQARPSSTIIIITHHTTRLDIFDKVVLISEGVVANPM